MDHDDRQPPIATPAVPGHFLDEAEDEAEGPGKAPLDLQTVCARISKRKNTKYQLGEIVNLDSRGFAEAEQHRAQLPPTPTLQELAKHVFTFLKDKQAELWSNIASHNFIITDLEAVNKLLGQLEGGGAVPGPRAYISVLGRYNVGKSTLLNALLSFDVLPTSQDAETAVTVFVQHRKIEVPELCKMSDGEVLKRGAENIKSYLEEVQQNVRDGVLSATSTEYLVRVPIPCFTRKRNSNTMITPLLVDTPGSNEVSQDKLKKLAYLNLQTATAYIYVMSFTELRNQHDYTAFEHIQERDQAVFNEGRIAIAVTKMDESYKAVTKKLTEPKVKEIVSSEIRKALELHHVSPEIVYPLSGDFAFQARVTARDGGSTTMVESMRLSWGNMMRDSHGLQAFNMAGAMSAQKLYGDLEESSHIRSLEDKIKLMLDQLDFIWQKSMATNCFLYINQALESLNDALKRIGHQLADSKATVDQCRDIKRLYDAITESLTKCAENHAGFVKQLEDSYAADTDTDKMMGKFKVHLDTFMKNVRTKIEAGNYTPKQLEADLDGIREEANEKLTQLCWQTTFDRCQQTLVSFLVIMTDKFGRMRSTLAKVCSQASSTGSLPQKPVPVPDSIEDKVRDVAPTLDQIPKRNIKVSAGQWVGYAACKLLFGLPSIQLIEKKALDSIEEDITEIVRDQHEDFFKDRKDFIVLHFFKRYCKEMTDLMDVLFDEYNQNCPKELSNIATRAHTELKEKETLQDTCLRWKFELMQWRSRMMVSYGDLLPAKEDD